MEVPVYNNVVIAQDKLTRYLLIYKDRDDKSKFLEQAGYTTENWEILATDLRLLFINGKLIFEEEDEYGKKYSVSGILTGPNSQALKVKTIWMYDTRKELTKFITLYPDKR
ncbi:MAG: hypothetical protein LCH91_24740 [Bacteroidetes bacterium]|jgi:hypothetical protein|nr:hypothetical protein [Bacteroidota bacterium]